MLERAPAPGRYYNTSVVLGPDGEVHATYRKAHLFDVDVPGEVSYRESDIIVAGDEVVVARLGEIDLGLTVCFDLRFPELYPRLAREGATVLAVPSAFAAATGGCTGRCWCAREPSRTTPLWSPRPSPTPSATRRRPGATR